MNCLHNGADTAGQSEAVMNAYHSRLTRNMYILARQRLTEFDRAVVTAAGCEGLPANDQEPSQSITSPIGISCEDFA